MDEIDGVAQALPSEAPVVGIGAPLLEQTADQQLISLQRST